MKIIMLTSFGVFALSNVSIASQNGDVILNKHICEVKECLLLADNKVISNYVPDDYLQKKEYEALDEEEVNEDDMQREEMEDMDNEFVEEMETESDEKEQMSKKKIKWWQFWK